MKNIKFLNIPQSYNPNDAFVVHLFGINDENELFQQLGEKLSFPDYFGFNWNAVFDLLRDFHWIAERKIVLIHDELPNLTKKELKTYLEVLVDSVQDWRDCEEHCLEVVFPEKTKDLILQICK